MNLDRLYDRNEGTCTGSEQLRLGPHTVIIVEGSYLLARRITWDIGILLYVNREIGRMRKIQREEEKDKGEFPTGKRVGEILPTWEELEEPTFFDHLMEQGLHSTNT